MGIHWVCDTWPVRRETDTSQHRASPPFGWYQFIGLYCLVNRGTRVWTTCPESLHEAERPGLEPALNLKTLKYLKKILNILHKTVYTGCKSDALITTPPRLKVTCVTCLTLTRSSCRPVDSICHSHWCSILFMWDGTFCPTFHSTFNFGRKGYSIVSHFSQSKHIPIWIIVVQKCFCCHFLFIRINL